MSALLFRPLLRPQAIGATVGLSLASLRLSQRKPIRLDSYTLDPGAGQAKGTRHYGQVNPKTVKQISSGSIIGLCGGLVVSAFSRSLAVVIGLLVIGVQWAASHGINVIPYKRLERYFKNVNVKSALQSNMAFKMAFGTTFALAAFAEF